MSMQEPSLAETTDRLLATFRKLIRPIVRLLLAKGITYPLLLEEIKRAFVDVANEEFKLEGKTQTDSRITLLTGVHRRDVHRIRNEVQQEVPSKANFSAQIIAQWVGNPKFLAANGQPKALAKTHNLDAEASFEGLVAMISKDIRSRPVLDEWQRTGIVTINEAGLVELNTQAFIPSQNLEEQLFFLGMNVHDHLAAAVNNTLNPNKMFERCVYYDQLTLDQVEALHAWVHDHGMDYLKTLNQTAMQTSASPLAEDTPVYRMNSGVYFYFEPSSQVEHER